MNAADITAFGIDIRYILIGVVGIILLEFILIISLFIKNSHLKQKYKKFLRGKNMKSMEDSIVEKFDAIETLANNDQVLEQRIDHTKQDFQKSYSKMELYKYKAFKDMGGNTSFILGLLDQNNDGILINAMNSREGCYLYAKEVVNGSSEVTMSEEETVALKKCMNK